jgi:hypothetical protein
MVGQHAEKDVGLGAILQPELLLAVGTVVVELRRSQ